MPGAANCWGGLDRRGREGRGAQKKRRKHTLILGEWDGATLALRISETRSNKRPLSLEKIWSWKLWKVSPGAFRPVISAADHTQHCRQVTRRASSHKTTHVCGWMEGRAPAMRQDSVCFDRCEDSVNGNSLRWWLDVHGNTSEVNQHNRLPYNIAFYYHGVYTKEPKVQGH